MSEIERRIATLEAEERSWRARQRAMIAAQQQAREKQSHVEEEMLRQKMKLDTEEQEARLNRLHAMRRAAEAATEFRETATTAQLNHDRCVHHSLFRASFLVSHTHRDIIS